MRKSITLYGLTFSMPMLVWQLLLGATLLLVWQVGSAGLVGFAVLALLLLI